jgi:hypothetical protein
MSYKDYLEFKNLVISKNPVYEEHSATGGNLDKIKIILGKKLNRSYDLFSTHNGIIACRRNNNFFEFKCGDNKVFVWDSVSNTFDSSKDIDLPNEDWSNENI